MERAAGLLTALLLRATKLVQIAIPLEAPLVSDDMANTINDGQGC